MVSPPLGLLYVDSCSKFIRHCASIINFLLEWLLWCGKWEAVRVVDRASTNRELKIKEALHLQMTPDNNKFNRDWV